MITDVRGKEVKVGDTVAFAGGGRGASEFWTGKVTQINSATITIIMEWTVETKQYSKEFTRKSRKFAILESV